MPKTIEEKLDNVLGIAEDMFDGEESTELAPLEPVYSNPDNRASDIKRDYEYSREKLYHLIERGQTALDRLVSVAQDSESPRAFEVVSTMVKTLTDSTRELVNLQKMMKEVEDAEDIMGKGAREVTNNNVFVGSTAELQQLVKDSRDAKSEE
jgi:hypothetical protein